MKYIVTPVVAFLFFFLPVHAQLGGAVSDQIPQPVSGTIERIERFESEYAEPRRVDIWFPEDYSAEKRYAVLYMHDGQMLFDSNITWNGTEWEVDEHAGELIKEKKIKDCIVVGIWNLSDSRYQDYFPQKTVEYLPEPYREAFLSRFPQGLSADNYLKFIVTELKPYIDRNYATLTGPEHTVMAGSSMGGLISLYAICEYPEVFGRVASLSIHSPMISSRESDGEDDTVPAAFREYLRHHLPPAGTRWIYMDYGNQTLDASYAPYQQKIDDVMREKGWTMPWWQTRFFPGTDHSERSWAARLDIPLSFLLGE